MQELTRLTTAAFGHEQSWNCGDNSMLSRLPVTFLILFAFGLSGCVRDEQRHATFECAGPRSQPLRYLLSLNDPREWMMTHDLEIVRTLYTYEIELPTIPKGPTHYEAAQLAQVEASYSVPETYERITGGSVDVDLEHQTANINLLVGGKPFEANGTYPLQYLDLLPCPPHSFDP